MTVNDPLMANRICSTCGDCYYVGHIGWKTYCCDYYLITGTRRPCPAGEDCTVKLIGKRRPYEKMR